MNRANFVGGGLLFTAVGSIALAVGGPEIPDKPDLTSVTIEGALKEGEERSTSFVFDIPDYGWVRLYRHFIDDHQAAAEALRRATTKTVVFHDREDDDLRLYELVEENANGTKTTYCTYEESKAHFKTNERVRLGMGWGGIIFGPICFLVGIFKPGWTG